MFLNLVAAIKKMFRPTAQIVKSPQPVISSVPPKVTEPTQKTNIKIYTFEEVITLPKSLAEKEFVKILHPIAERVQEKYPIDVWVAIAQASHESEHGTSDLSRVALNLYGIKATRGWAEAGKKIMSFGTKEEIKGTLKNVEDSFRAYDSWFESMSDWARLMTTTEHYKHVAGYMQAGYGYGIRAIEEIARAGYATDSNYAQKVIAVYQRLKGGQA